MEESHKVMALDAERWWKDLAPTRTRKKGEDERRMKAEAKES